MTFLEKLDYLMAEKRINKPRLSELSGVPYTTIDGFYKKGYSNAKLGNLRKIAAALGTSLDYLVDDDEGESGRPSLEAEQLARAYDALDDWGRQSVRAVLKSETARVEHLREAARPKTRIVPLLGSSFAAGAGEPDFGNVWKNYEVPADSPAEFAIRVNGDSMEPWLPDGSIQLCRKVAPNTGEVGAFLIDGEFLCKQYCRDFTGTLHLFSLNRERKSMDRHIQAAEDRQLLCFGTVLMEKRLPLPLD